jgi:hypothetical protein
MKATLLKLVGFKESKDVSEETNKVESFFNVMYVGQQLKDIEYLVIR